MGRYKHLTIGEREDIMCMRREGRRVGEIAREIGRDKSTVSRELRRNSCERFYRASTAQRRYEARRERCRRPRLLDDPERLELVRSRVLEGRWVDKVNIKIDDRVTVPSSLARLHNRHWRHRTFAAFDHPSLLLSAGRSLSL